MSELNNIKSRHDLFGMGNVITEEINLKTVKDPKRVTAFVVSCSEERPLLVDHLNISVKNDVLSLTGCAKYVVDFILEVMHASGAHDDIINVASEKLRDKYKVRTLSLSQVKCRTAKFIASYLTEIQTES